MNPGTRSLGTAVLFGLLCLGLASAAFSQTSGGTLVLGFEDIDTLDTFRSWLASPLEVLGLVCDTLFAFDNNLRPQPVLVASWAVSEDQLKWSFKLKEGISFHDGTPFNAKELKDYLLGFFIEKSFTGWMYSSVKDIVVTGEYALDFVLSEPAPLLLDYLAYPWNIIQPKGAYDKYGERYGFDALVGTGPFAFQEWVQGEKIVLKKNPKYRHGPDFIANRGPAYLDEIIFRILPEAATLINELRSGNIDSVQGVPATHLVALRGDTKIAMISHPSYYSEFLFFNMERPISQDWRIRAAVNHAIDRTALINAGYSGAAAVSYGLVAPASTGYWSGIENFGREILTYDPAASKALLEKAGWVLPAGRQVREREGEKLKVKLGSTNSATYQTMGEALADMLADVGFEVELATFELAAYYDVSLAGDFDLMLMAWVDESGYGVLNSKCSIGAIPNTNDARYRDLALDALIKLSQTTTSSEERDAVMAAAQQKIVADLVYIPLSVPYAYLAAKKDRVGGLDALQQHPWWLDLVLGLSLYIK